MANFSSFFPVAGGGGGGFTKMKKISTLRATDEATDKVAFSTTLNISGDVLTGATTLSGRPTITADRQYFTAEDSYVGMTFEETGQIHTVTASTAHTEGNYATLTFTPALSTGTIADNEDIVFNTATKTINPATDLGLSDGDSIGFLLAGGNATGVLRGTAIITAASADLVITPGLSSGTASTITGGLTLTSADGNLDVSFPRRSTTYSGGYAGYALESAGGMGIDGYGVGNQINTSSFRNGNGGYGKDGAILLFY